VYSKMPTKMYILQYNTISARTPPIIIRPNELQRDKSRRLGGGKGPKTIRVFKTPPVISQRSPSTKFAGNLSPKSIVFVLLLLSYGSASAVPPSDLKAPFAWNQDAYWTSLEVQFQSALTMPRQDLAREIERDLAAVDSLIGSANNSSLSADAPIFSRVENQFFQLGALMAAQPDRLPDYLRLFSRLRIAVKEQSVHWDMNSKPSRDCIYRLIYGGRMAVEQVILRSPQEAVSDLVLETDEFSATPSARILGVEIHSGDILVSRGGAPTSALIARGNDYAGNFSHVALAYVDSATSVISMLEAHIEKGVTVAGIEQYLKDTKLRVMVLRLRHDLPALQADPLLPHKAAGWMLRRARGAHISYDFAMDTEDTSRMFCSEVVAEAYAVEGVNLWAGLTHISNPGVKSWLAEFGVKNFVTKEPSDLEYDPQLRVVAEWRNFETLKQANYDNAVVDVMLEGADRGQKLGYDWYLLPVAVTTKLYSTLLNQLGRIGPIPEGMSATAALRNKWFSRRHREIKKRLEHLAEEYSRENGYAPPYWDLVELAKKACAERR
jgi:hypothetical protein